MEILSLEWRVRDILPEGHIQTRVLEFIYYLNRSNATPQFLQSNKTVISVVSEHRQGNSQDVKPTLLDSVTRYWTLFYYQYMSCVSEQNKNAHNLLPAEHGQYPEYRIKTLRLALWRLPFRTMLRCLAMASTSSMLYPHNIISTPWTQREASTLPLEALSPRAKNKDKENPSPAESTVDAISHPRQCDTVSLCNDNQK